MSLYTKKTNKDTDDVAAFMLDWAADLCDEQEQDADGFMIMPALDDYAGAIDIDKDVSINQYSEQLKNKIDDFDFDALKNRIDARVQNGERIFGSDIRDINAAIQDHYYGVNQALRDDKIEVEGLYDQMNYSITIREQNGVDLDATEIPAYVEALIGSPETPEAMQYQIDSARSIGDALYADRITDIHDNVHALQTYKFPKGLYDKRITDLHETVYALQTYNFTNVPHGVTGQNPNQPTRSPSLITRDTLDMLGPDYRQYCDKMFEKRLSNLGKDPVASTSDNKSRVGDYKRVDHPLAGSMSSCSKGSVNSFRVGTTVLSDRVSRELPPGMDEMVLPELVDDDQMFGV